LLLAVKCLAFAVVIPCAQGTSHFTQLRLFGGSHSMSIGRLFCGPSKRHIGEKLGTKLVNLDLNFSLGQIAFIFKF